VAGTRGGDAGKSEVLKQNAELSIMSGFVLGLGIGNWGLRVLRCSHPRGLGRSYGGLWRGVNHGDGGFGPGGGSGGKAKRKLHVIPIGQHVGSGRAGSEPGIFSDEQARADAPSHRIS